MDEKNQPSLQEKLQDEIGNCNWLHLTDHLRRDAVILLSRPLELIDVALALAKNDSSNIQQWMDQGLISKPTADQIEYFDSDSSA
ncbi:MAG TPA: DUF2288 family protein [Myxococcales bacterium]|nr:DUF2288 family protein [Myxococcales bacterium]